MNAETEGKEAKGPSRLAYVNDPGKRPQCWEAETGEQEQEEDTEAADADPDD